MPLVLRGAKSCPQPGTDQELLDAFYRGLELVGDRRAEAATLASYGKRFDSVTPRERESMALVAAERFNKRIAAELEFSEVTVKSRARKVMRKIDAKSLPGKVVA